ncbi:hypothetical protein JCM19231_4853 [Vibrio ishigakensis]|uniref:Uncharacterized protein n=1 Tax=Vibrio ishigakensis TaxID=1481914 RepID=A0A0B8NY16_9VIBR|nr:DUF6789 family protein [Vibrio ishigakensis]GAM59405.1 hypothetical protein JCM19231_4853 [Vibrio ishigakensis]
MFNINNLIRGFFAGFIATLALTSVMMIKSALGVMPEFNPIHILANLATEQIGLSMSIGVGWAIHFLLGSAIWGGALVILNSILPGSKQLTKALVLSTAAWLAMMVVLMPLANLGLFGLTLGIKVPVMTLILHLVFGIALGVSYSKLNKD